MSEHIQNLETRLNCKLFDRLGRTILPTEEAQILYPRAVAILEEMARLEEDISAAGKSVSGKLVIGASTIPGTYILPGIAASFKEQYPAISFEIRIGASAKISETVAANELFLGVVGAKNPSSKLQYQLFIEDELILAAAGSSSIPARISTRELCTLPFIVREMGSGTRQSTELLLARQEHTLDMLNVCATLGSSGAVKESVKANLGVSVISKLAVQEELASGKIKQVEVAGIALKRDFYIVTSTLRTLPNHYAQFLKRLLGQ